jgi:hypothetical protein
MGYWCRWGWDTTILMQIAIFWDPRNQKIYEDYWMYLSQDMFFILIFNGDSPSYDLNIQHCSNIL